MKNKGITLVALVITIIILLILAGITINSLTGSGLFKKAQDAKEKSIEANAKETVQLEVLGSYGTDGNLDIDLLNTNLKRIKGLTYKGKALNDDNKISEMDFSEGKIEVELEGIKIEINRDGEVEVKGKSNNNNKDPEDKDPEEIVSDSIVIPDKYNTGAKGDLEVAPEENYAGNADKDITFLWATTIYKVNVSSISKEVVTVKNRKFNKGVTFLNESNSKNKNKKIIFKNCAFTNITTGRKGLESWELEFENCSVNQAFGSNMSFNNCYFGGSKYDCINPFQNVSVNNCFFSDLSRGLTAPNPSADELHTDGVQMYGYKSTNSTTGEVEKLDVQNIHFYNCRMELPNMLYTYRDAYANAAFMIQTEQADLHDVSFNKCIINGGGFSIYIAQKGDTQIRNLTLKDIKVGCSAWYGTLYNGSVAVPRSEFEERNIIYNTSNTDKLYVGSVWKETDGVHISVSNDTSVERTLVVELADGTKKEFKIKACYPGSTWWDNVEKYNEESRDKYTYADFPFDIEIVVENTSSVKCYDKDGNTLIRTQKID